MNSCFVSYKFAEIFSIKSIMWKIGVNALAIVILAIAVAYQLNYKDRDPNYDPNSLGISGGEFTLVSDQGLKSLKDFSGKTVILYFGFASCPDVCPMALSYLNGALRDFPEDKIQVVFVSVDHQRDTPESVGKYARYFNEDYVGLSGNKEQIDKVAKQYGVYYKFIDLKSSQMGYTVDHTSRFFIVDKKGELQKVVRSDEDPEAFKKALASVLRQEGV